MKQYFYTWMMSLKFNKYGWRIFSYGENDKIEDFKTSNPLYKFDTKTEALQDVEKYLKDNNISAQREDE